MTTPGRMTRTVSAFDNPWMTMLWICTAIALIVGVATTSSNAPDESSYGGGDPQLYALGLSLLGIGGILLTGLLVAGAVCWQIRRQQQQPSP